jgi:hypothetical protein
LGIQQLLNEAGDSLAVISYHSGDPYATADGNARISFYGIGGYPTMKFDAAITELGGIPSPGNMYPYYRPDFNTRKVVSSPLEITLSGTYDANLRTGSVHAHMNCTGPESVFGVAHFVLTETSIYQVWRNLDSLYSVVRDMLPDAVGDTVTLGPGATGDQTEDFSLDPTWNADHCEVVVFVQRWLGGTEVYQAAKIPVSEMVGVSDGPPGGLVAPASSVLLSSFPNPFQDGTTLRYCLPTSAGRVTLQIYDLAGRRVRTVLSGSAGEGSHAAHWDGRNEAGQRVPGGVYIARLATSLGSHSAKIVVLR